MRGVSASWSGSCAGPLHPSSPFIELACSSDVDAGIRFTRAEALPAALLLLPTLSQAIYHASKLVAGSCRLIRARGVSYCTCHDQMPSKWNYQICSAGSWTCCGRPEERIAVVSHAGFLRHTLEQFAGPGMADPLLLREFQNCEMRCLVLAPAINGSTGPCLQASVNFPGGDAGLGLV